ncbi:MAG: hypothetical protein E7047_00995 [Lentisphaerae bacterium]|nr:hypothetical protein [Lentisphaerota bacterium]
MSRFRRKNRQLPVSFFAFQDIITALAGALLIIVLLAAYNRNHASDGAQSLIAKSDYELLQKRLQLRQDELRSKSRALKKLRREQSRNHDRQSAASVNSQYAAAEAEVNASLLEWELLHKKLSAEIAGIRQETAQADPAVRELLEQVAQLERLQSVIKERKNTFKLDNDDSEALVILDCRRGCWLWSDHRQQKLQLGADDPTPQAALNELRSRLKAIKADKIRLIIAIRPSAGKFAQALKDQLSREFPTVRIIAEPLVSENSGGFEL